MRNLYLYVCLLLYGFTAIAQNQQPFRCGTPDEVTTGPVFFTPFNTPLYTGSTDLEYLNSFAPITFKIFFWNINRTDGTGDYTITAQDIQLNMDRVNEMFKPMGICFVLQGYGSINNSGIYENTNLGAITSYANSNGNVVPNCFNVYLPKSLTQGNGVTNHGSDKIAMVQGGILGHYEWIRGTILAHELAHTFGLMHPWGGANSTLTTQEHVTRDMSSPDYNADTKGDLIHDTPAMVSFWDEATYDGVTIYEIVDVNNCEYLGDLTDNLGVPFDLAPADVGNPMAYTWDPCVTGFTVGQGIRIREYIDGTPTAASVLAMTTTACVTCSENLAITLPVVASQYYKAENNITASSQVENDIQVIYAGEEITLLPGFETGQETVLFIAEVNPCNISNGRFANPDIAMSTDTTEVTGNIFSISPNPANSFATIASGEEISDILVTSLDGKVLFKTNPQANNMNINIDSYTTGIYNVMITTVNGKKQTQKLVKN